MKKKTVELRIPEDIFAAAVDNDGSLTYRIPYESTVHRINTDSEEIFEQMG